jgi:hypothetical protein
MKERIIMTTPTRTPRDRDLPGMEDRGLADLDALALDYADIRDRRIDLNTEEADLKARLLAAMHKHGKEFYKRNGVEIRVIKGDEDVKVKVGKRETPDDDDDNGDDEETDPPTGDPAASPPPMFEDPRDVPAPREDPPPTEAPRE